MSKPIKPPKEARAVIGRALRGIAAELAKLPRDKVEQVKREQAKRDKAKGA